MKKVLVFLTMLLLSGYCYAEPVDFKDIPVNASVYYNPETETWGSSCPDKCIKFTRSLTDGSNKFSVYITNGLEYDPNSTREFFYNGDLIGYNHNTLKFHRLYFEDGALKTEKLNEKELQEMFPDCKIIRVSNFYDNTMKIKRPLFKDQKFLIMNDTNTMFYNYYFENLDNSNEAFNCIFTPKRARKYYFSPREKSVLYNKYTFLIRYMI